MGLVGADDGGLIFLAVVERDFGLPRIGDDVIVSEDVSWFIDDETGALAFLRDEAVEEVEGHDARGDVDDGSDVFVVNADVVLLFGIERFAAGSFGDFNLLRRADPIGGPEAAVAIGGEIEEGVRQNDYENKITKKSHRGSSRAHRALSIL